MRTDEPSVCMWASSFPRPVAVLETWHHGNDYRQRRHELTDLSPASVLAMLKGAICAPAREPAVRALTEGLQRDGRADWSWSLFTVEA